MSFMDKLKAMFSGGSESPDHDHPAAVEDVPPVPPTPVDPLGSSMPEAGPVPPSTPPADRDDENI
jgi:hypothetical protein